MKIICYNNDNAFSSEYKKSYWLNFKSNCKFSDFILSYRLSDIDEYNKISDAKVIYFPPFVTNTIIDYSFLNYKSFKKSIYATFIGHYEDDGRLEILNYLYENNLDIRVFGPKSGWNKSILKKIGLQFLP